jgi:hypothetical protein
VGDAGLSPPPPGTFTPALAITIYPPYWRAAGYFSLSLPHSQVSRSGVVATVVKRNGKGGAEVLPSAGRQLWL